MKKIKLLILSLFFSMVILPGYGQSDLKTYRGPYPGLRISDNQDGEAIYTYIPNPEGGRIFEGPFEFSWHQDYEGFIKGNFNNNKQSGEWMAKKWEAVEYNDYKTRVMVTFKDGVLDGPAKIIIGDESYGYFIYFNFILKNGVLDGPFQIAKNNYNQFLRMEGEMVNNIPTGTAYISSEYYYHEISIKPDFANSQVLISEIKEDTRTGDIWKEENTVPYRSSIIESLFQVIGFNILKIDKLLSLMILRDSKPYENTILEAISITR